MLRPQLALLEQLQATLAECGRTGVSVVLAGDAVGPVDATVVERVQGTPWSIGLPLDGQTPVFSTAAGKVVWMSVPGQLPQVYACPSSAAVRQLVYLSGPAAVDLADASDPTKMYAQGFIATKPSLTTCTLQNDGELAGFIGLLPDRPYYADPTTPGGITPAAPTAGGTVRQQVAIAKSATVLKPTIAIPSPLKL